MSEKKTDKGDGRTVLELGRMDFDALRKDCGACEDENGVSLWTLLEALRRNGVKEVNLI